MKGLTRDEVKHRGDYLAQYSIAVKQAHHEAGVVDMPPLEVSQVDLDCISIASGGCMTPRFGDGATFLGMELKEEAPVMFCPFCDSTKCEVNEVGHQYSYAYRLHVHCPSCKAQGPTLTFDKHRDGAQETATRTVTAQWERMRRVTI